MAWASSRQTTRVEDIAYCLLGLFNVSLPLMYGEGHRAFYRLQEAIMTQSNDHSLFAWTDHGVLRGSLCGLLARSPYAFRKRITIPSLGSWTPDYMTPEGDSAASFTKTNQGIKIELPLVPYKREEAHSLYLGLLGYGHRSARPAIILKRIFRNEFARVYPHRLVGPDEANQEHDLDIAASEGLVILQRTPIISPKVEDDHRAFWIDASQIYKAGFYTRDNNGYQATPQRMFNGLIVQLEVPRGRAVVRFGHRHWPISFALILHASGTSKLLEHRHDYVNDIRGENGSSQIFLTTGEGYSRSQVIKLHQIKEPLADGRLSSVWLYTQQLQEPSIIWRSLTQRNLLIITAMSAWFLRNSVLSLTRDNTKSPSDLPLLFARSSPPPINTLMELFTTTSLILSHEARVNVELDRTTVKYYLYWAKTQFLWPDVFTSQALIQHKEVRRANRMFRTKLGVPDPLPWYDYLWTDMLGDMKAYTRFLFRWRIAERPQQRSWGSAYSWYALEGGYDLSIPVEGAIPQRMALGLHGIELVTRFTPSSILIPSRDYALKGASTFGWFIFIMGKQFHTQSTFLVSQAFSNPLPRIAVVQLISLAYGIVRGIVTYNRSRVVGQGVVRSNIANVIASIIYLNTRMDRKMDRSLTRLHPLFMTTETPDSFRAQPDKSILMNQNDIYHGLQFLGYEVKHDRSKSSASRESVSFERSSSIITLSFSEARCWDTVEAFLRSEHLDFSDPDLGTTLFPTDDSPSQIRLPRRTRKRIFAVNGCIYGLALVARLWLPFPTIVDKVAWGIAAFGILIIGAVVSPQFAPNTWEHDPIRRQPRLTSRLDMFFRVAILILDFRALFVPKLRYDEFGEIFLDSPYAGTTGICPSPQVDVINFLNRKARS